MVGARGRQARHFVVQPSIVFVARRGGFEFDWLMDGLGSAKERVCSDGSSNSAVVVLAYDMFICSFHGKPGLIRYTTRWLVALPALVSIPSDRGSQAALAARSLARARITRENAFSAA